jgi:hypothetical protein
MPNALHRPLALTLVALLCAAAACVNIGKKEWPKPVKSEDRFSFDRVAAARRAECLTVDLLVGGKFANLASVTVLLQAVGEADGCAACPFVPTRHVPLAPGDPGFERSGPSLRVTVCGLDPAKAYRFTVIGQNVFRALGQVESEVRTAEP